MCGESGSEVVAGQRMMPGAPSGSLRRSAARGSLITLATQAVRVVVLLASTIVLGRLIAPTEFGLLAMVVAVSGIAEIFRDVGLSMAALRRTDLTQQQRSNLFWINAAAGLVLALGVSAIAWPLAAFYQQPRLVNVVPWIAPIYLLNGLATQFRVSITQDLRFGALATIDIVAPIFALGVAIGIALTGAGLTALVAQLTLGSATTLAFSVALAHWWPSLPRRTAGMRELLTFGASYAATQILSYATRNIDSIAIGRVWGASSLGFYDRAFQLSVAPLNQINAPMSRVGVPVLARVVADKPRYLSALRDAQLVATYVTSSLLFVAGGLGVPIVILLIGPHWAFTGQILGILAVGSVFRSIQQIAYWMFMTQGLASSQLKLYLVGQPIIIVCLLGGLMWGPIGVAVGSTIGWACFWLLALLWVGRVSDLDVRPMMVDAIRVVGLVGAPAGVASLCVALWVPLAPIWVVLIGLAAAASWFGIVALISHRVRADLSTLARLGHLALAGGARHPLGAADSPDLSAPRTHPARPANEQPDQYRTED